MVGCMSISWGVCKCRGKKGGQFYTPKAIVKLMVEMIEPYKEECMTLLVVLVVCL